LKGDILYPTDSSTVSGTAKFRNSVLNDSCTCMATVRGTHRNALRHCFQLVPGIYVSHSLKTRTSVSFYFICA